MIDMATAYNQYKFLGNEFLTWLWYTIASQDQQGFADESGKPFSFTISDKITCEIKNENDVVETIKIKGDNADLKEALVSLNKGALVTELSLSVHYSENTWDFVLKGENFNISNLKHPETAKPQSDDELDGVILEKIYLWGIVPDLIDVAFRDFYKKRVNGSWAKTAGEIARWATNRGD